MCSLCFTRAHAQGAVSARAVGHGADFIIANSFWLNRVGGGAERYAESGPSDVWHRRVEILWSMAASAAHRRDVAIGLIGEALPSSSSEAAVGAARLLSPRDKYA